MLEVEVTDTGIGIPREKQQLIFEAFSQEDGSFSRRYGGTGLGLTISNRLVELMHGKMGVESEPGKGSTFRFSLRLEIDRDARDRTPDPVFDGLGGKRMLIVDDNATNRRVLCGMLNKWGVLCETAVSGPQAIEMAGSADGGFDCILLDVQMPEMDGFTVAARLIAGAQENKPPCIVLLTSSGAKGDSQRCKAMGVKGYFTKPIVPDDLLAALQSVLGSQNKAEAGDELVTRHSIKESSPILSVLVVEDNPINQRVAARILQKAGHQFRIAGNGEEALNLLENHVYDVVLMDMQMPVMDGLEATRRIREKEASDGGHIPIIAMTANAMQGDREICLRAGMDDYISKPINANELKERLASIASHKLAAQFRAPDVIANASVVDDGVDVPTVLIVDDEVTNQQIFESPLRKEGYQVICATSGEEALKIVETRHPDVILLDAMMPGTDGFAVAETLKRQEQTSGIPIIMITALGDQDSRMRALNGGAEEFLTKPVSQSELVARVRNMIRLKRTQKLSEMVVELNEPTASEPDAH